MTPPSEDQVTYPELPQKVADAIERFAVSASAYGSSKLRNSPDHTSIIADEMRARREVLVQSLREWAAQQERVSGGEQAAIEALDRLKVFGIEMPILPADLAHLEADYQIVRRALLSPGGDPQP